MLEITAVEPLHDRVVRLTLSDGAVVERDLGELLDGRGIFARISRDDVAFREVYVANGTLAWPGDVDLAPETVIWDGPYPIDESAVSPKPNLRVRRPSYVGALADVYGDGALAEERASWPPAE
jgi:hypothetical protein